MCHTSQTNYIREKFDINEFEGFNTSSLTGRLAQLVERRTRGHTVSGLYRCGFESPAGQLKLLVGFRMRR